MKPVILPRQNALQFGEDRFGLKAVIGAAADIDADGAAIIIHQNPDTYQTGTKGQGVGGGELAAAVTVLDELETAVRSAAPRPCTYSRTKLR